MKPNQEMYKFPDTLCVVISYSTTIYKLFDIIPALHQAVCRTPN